MTILRVARTFSFSATSVICFPVNRDEFDVLGERFIKLSSLNAAGTSAGNSIEQRRLIRLLKF